ncbi:hypothetical protein ACA910_002901 [Epithemia clementina (nom. ined.)]
MMLHAAIHWNETADPTIWPTAVLHAVWLFNHFPSLSTGISPQDIFTSTHFPQRKFHDLHVWGCPTYVLHKKISDGMKLPRWQPRSDRCMFVGLSPTHATNVPLVLNLQTGAITPQFHVIFDDWFATVTASVDDRTSPRHLSGPITPGSSSVASSGDTTADSDFAQFPTDGTHNSCDNTWVDRRGRIF